MQFCDVCGIRPATIFLTKISGDASAQSKMCEECAHVSSDAVLDAMNLDGSAPEEIIGHLFDQAVAAGLLTPDEAATLKANGDMQSLGWQQLSPEDLAELVNAAADNNEPDKEITDESEESDPFAAEENSSNDFDLGELARMTHDAHRAGLRCPKCDMTWDRLKQDGRAGCAQCYEAFDEELRGVMEKMQRGASHNGKVPRSAQKRRNRLEHLRRLRDNKLELLHRRLEESIAAEKYEEAAKLRDKIKVVSSTIVDE